MLIEFRVENHRSIGEEQALTFEAANLGGPDKDSRPRVVPGHDKPLLPAAALYGPNASGKTNFLAALAFMSEAVSSSFRMWEPDGGVPRTPFAWGPMKNKPSAFEAMFLIDGVKYRYGFVVNDKEVEEEYLYAWPQGRKQTWWERDGQEIKFGRHFEVGKGMLDLIRESTGRNALCLSSAAQLRLDAVLPIYSWFTRGIRRVNFGADLRSRIFDSISRRRRLAELLLSSTGQEGSPEGDNSDLPKSRIAANFRRLLNATDTGICDIRATRETSPQLLLPGFKSPYELLFQHQANDEDSWIPYEEESHGTQAFIDIALPILEALEYGGLVILDELERGLHSWLSAKIIGLFNSPETNPHNAQILFTTHDTYLLRTVLGDSVLRRDQVWLTEKTFEGSSKIYPLTNYKPRKDENLERGYLEGRYGATPYLGTFPYVLEPS